MIPYWLLFGYFIFGAVLSNSTATGRSPSLAPMLFSTLVMMLLIGLRYEVGADWITYSELFQYASYVDFWRATQLGDPGYQALNWTLRHLGFGFWVINLVCAAFFCWGLLRFTRVQADPWLAFVIAIPYLVIVVAMGYTRQAAAIGIVMAGLASLQRGTSLARFAVYVAFAALFHRTAVVVFPLVVFASDRNRLLNLLAGIATSILLYDLFLADSMNQFVKSYIDQQYNSQGAAIRVTMNLVPATIFLAAGKRFGLPPLNEKILRNFSLTAWALLIALLVSPSSTAVDRLALYVIPLQIAVLARVPRAFNDRGLLRIAVMAYSGMILFVWLNFAKHAQYWLPYQFYPFH